MSETALRAKMDVGPIPPKKDEGPGEQVGFRVPRTVLAKFDRMCEVLGYNRTELLVYLMRSAIEEQETHGGPTRK